MRHPRVSKTCAGRCGGARNRSAAGAPTSPLSEMPGRWQLPPYANLDSVRPTALTRSSLRPLSTPPAQPPSVAPKSCQEVKFLSRASALSEARNWVPGVHPRLCALGGPTSTRFMDDGPGPKFPIAREGHDLYGIGCRLRKRDRDRFLINGESVWGLKSRRFAALLIRLECPRAEVRRLPTRSVRRNTGARSCSRGRRGRGTPQRSPGSRRSSSTR